MKESLSIELQYIRFNNQKKKNERFLLDKLKSLCKIMIIYSQVQKSLPYIYIGQIRERISLEISRKISSRTFWYRRIGIQ